MSFTRWLRNLRSALTPGRAERNHRRQRSLRATTHRPHLEALEDRCLLSFSPAANYAVGYGPQAVVTADLNGDGRLDLVSANYAPSWESTQASVSVLLGNPDGTFQPARNHATDFNLASIAVGDVDGDGIMDLVGAGTHDLAVDWQIHGVSVLLGNGDGSFQNAPNTEFSNAPLSVAVGDFNADGNLDLVVATAGEPGGGYCDEYGCFSWPGYPGSVTILLGNGDGSFAYGNTFGAGDVYPYSVAVADFNGDGRPDLAATGLYSDSVTLFLGNGDGTFVAADPLGTGSRPVFVAVADVNADGRPDLVTANVGSHIGYDYGYGSVSVLLHNADGTFQAAQIYGARLRANWVSVADFNGDGKPDLAASTESEFETDTGSVYVFLGRGDGNFSPALIAAAGLGASAVAAGDFNGDGWLDAAAANTYGNNVAVLVNDHSWPPLDAPSITINDVTVTEGNIGTVNATFTLSLSAAYTQPVTVHFATANGTATAGSDYTAVSGTVTFAAGQTSQTVTVAVLGDRLPEPTETFVVNLSAATYGLIIDSQEIGTIVDDEPRISISDVTKYEGKKGQTTLFTFTVTLSAAYDQAVTMSYTTVDGTAKTSDKDYKAKSGTLTFAPGETTKTITIEVIGDNKKEANETFYLDLFGNSGDSLFTKNRGLGTILNDD